MILPNQIDRQAVFLDRDGVINKATVHEGKSFPPQKLEDFNFIDGVQHAMHKLRASGFLVIVFTNQPDVATGKQSKFIVELMHQKLFDLELVDDVFVCFHTDLDDCDCRKPKPGMLIAAALKWGINLKKSYVVGDRWRDIEAAQSAQCNSYFIDYKYKEKRPILPFTTVINLEEAVDMILKNIEPSL